MVKGNNYTLLYQHCRAIRILKDFLKKSHFSKIISTFYFKNVNFHNQIETSN